MLPWWLQLLVQSVAIVVGCGIGGLVVRWLFERKTKQLNAKSCAHVSTGDGQP